MSNKVKLNKVAVYGSLLKGFGNHRLLGSSELLGTAMIEGFDMYSLGHFPAITPTKVGKPRIQVEVYEVDQDVMNALDRLEGYPRFYDRVEVEYNLGEGVEKAWVYFIHNVDTYRHNQIPLQRIETGSWRDWRVQSSEY